MLNDHPTVAIDPIPDFPGYFICRLGVVFSTNGRWSQCLVPLKLTPDPNGYLDVKLWRDGKRYHRTAHQLVLETYVGPKPEGMESRHLNSIRSDNRLSNLAWGTKLENGEDKRQAGSFKGTRNHKAKLTEDDVRIIRTMRPCDAARRFGIDPTNAGLIRSRKTWRHVE